MHRNRRFMNAGLTLLGALALVSPSARAQGVTGSAISGTVTEEGGKPIEGAAVQLKNPSTGDTFNATTDKDGRYFIDNVPSGGPYVLTVSSSGHSLTPESEIQLALGQRSKRDVTMRASFEEEVQVVAHFDALGDKGRNGASTTLKAGAITELPVFGRNFTSLLSTDPRVSGGDTPSIAGQNNRFNNIQIDGGANNDLFGLASNGTPGGQANAKPLSIEAIKEFVVQVAPFDVRLGMFAGGLVNAVTKSGTNGFHGVVFGYNQNKSLSGKRDDPTYLDFSTWQFGAAIGGPIVPDKAHFFISGDFQQKTQPYGNTFQISGTDDVADLAKSGFTKATADSFTAILTKYGITNAGGVLGQDIANPDRNVFVKVDTNVIENSKLELSYNFVNARQDVLARFPTGVSAPNNLRGGYQLGNSGYGQSNTTNTVRGKLTTNFDEGKISNEFLTGFSIIRDARDTSVSAPLVLVKVGTIGAADAYLSAGQERFSQANSLDQNIYQLQDNVTFAIDKHRLTAGTSNEILNIRNVFLQAANGVYLFDSLDSFNAGTPAAYQRRFSASPLQEPGTAKFTVTQLGAYVQDEWSLMDNLTLTPGFRFDVPFLSGANQNAALLAAALPIDTSKVPSGNVLLSPRLGFNWDVERNSDTIVRGGVGVFSGRPPYVWVSNAYAVNGLSQVELTCVPGAGKTTLSFPFSADVKAQPSDCTGGTGTPGAPTNVGEVDYFDPGTKYPQNLRLALGVDRRLPFGIVATLDLLYTRDVNNWYTTDENLVPLGLDGENRTIYGTLSTRNPGPTSTLSSVPSRVDSINLRQAVKVFNKDGGHVGSATLQLQKSFLNRYNLSVGYTYSRSYDRMSFTSSQAFSNLQFAPLDGDIQNRQVRPSAFDRPHKITVVGTAALPYGFGAGLIYTGQSGTPYTWSVNGDINGDGINGNDLPFIPNDPSQISLRDPAQYQALQDFIGTQKCLREARGNLLQRSACRNPWTAFVDARFSWTSPAVSGQKIEVQLDIFNVMNLLNSDWGHFDQDASFETHSAQFLRSVGYDNAKGRPLYNFVAPTTIRSTLFSPTASRWRMQLGARYLF